MVTRAHSQGHLLHVQYSTQTWARAAAFPQAHCHHLSICVSRSQTHAQHTQAQLTSLQSSAESVAVTVEP